MRVSSTIVFTLVVCAATAAQEQNVASLSVTTANNHPMLNIANQSKLPIEAFLVSVADGKANRPLTRIYYDTHAGYRHDSVIPAGTSYQATLPHIIGDPVPIATLQAVVYSDGTTQGDIYWVKELLRRRTVLIDRLQEIIALLRNISDQHLPRDLSIDILEKARQARLEASPGASRPEERVWNDQIFHITKRSLQGELRVNGSVPDVSVATQHLLKFYSEWLSDLQAAKPQMSQGAHSS
jgi:hypothetical protein